MRTAIAPETGLADDGQLYAYEALSPGQRFWARLESDDVGLLTKVKDALLGEAFVGRSKTAEFGRVRIEAVEPWGDDIVSTTAAATGARFIWLLSDSWFLGVDGLPTGRPEPEIFSAARIDWSRSFLRSRRVTPFNAAWQARAEERTLVLRGSVVAVDGCALAPGLATFGIGQERGYGLALVATAPPRTLLTRSIALSPEDREAKWEVARAPAQSSFVTWLRTKHEAVRAKTAAAGNAEDDLAVLRAQYAAARRISGEPVGPTAS